MCRACLLYHHPSVSSSRTYSNPSLPPSLPPRSYDSYIEGRKLVAAIVNGLRTALMDMYINDPR